ncbi:MAG: dihydrodipicolinate synthase family protein [Betaproteobacteria bacterium]
MAQLVASTPTLQLPRADGALVAYTMHPAVTWAPPVAGTVWNRVAFAAAHVVPDARAAVDPWVGTAIDWDTTLAFRRHLWSLGFGVAEAMDTAQRGMGLDWTTSLELIKRSVAEARSVPGAVVFSGAGTDHLTASPDVTLAQVVAAYAEQCSAVEAVGGRIILMASRALAACAQSPDDYAHVYDRVLSQVRAPIILHWLGEMFDPALGGYWVGAGGLASDPHHVRAAEVCASVITANASKVDGVKVSLLDASKEIALRDKLPAGVRMYTGDDFNYAALIGGDASGYSDALLGIFDAIAPAASAALTALAAGDRATFESILAPTVPLSRHIFAAPTRFYKTGVVFMAWLNGHQSHFTMVGGQQSTRSIVHLAELFRLADAAGLLRDPNRAAARMRALLTVYGIDA